MSRGIVEKPPADLADEREHRIMIAEYLRQEDLPYMAAFPTEGTHVQGDRVMNSAPAASGYIGWVCVTSGEPGAWKGFGEIEP